MVLSGKPRGNYDVDNVKPIYENYQRWLTQLRTEYNALIGTVGKALAEANAQKAQKQTHSLKLRSENSSTLRDRVTLWMVKRNRYEIISSAQSPTKSDNLFRIKS